LVALGKFVAEKRPDVIINIGDFYDFPSLSSYDEGTVYAEGQRLEQDILAGDEAMEAFLDEFIHIEDYKPDMIFTVGNHEQRLERLGIEKPSLYGNITYDDLEGLEMWDVYDFLHPVMVDGVWYCHYFVNPFTGKPRGGTAQNKLNQLKFSFSMGHVQKFEYARDHLNNGGVINGMVSGAFYQHDERYKGPQGNNHWRGVVLKSNVHNGDYDFEMIRLETIMKEYK
jgi:hypothetical protein